MKAATIALALAAGLALPAAAQNTDKPLPRAGHEIAAPVTLHHEMEPLMRELSQALERMAGEMAAVRSQQAQNGMAVRMQELSGMLQQMSGLLARPAHGAEDRAQLDEMRRRLQALSGSSVPRARVDVDSRMAQIETELDRLEVQLERVRAAKEPAERSRLLAEHSRDLRRTMGALRELNRAFSPQMRAMMGGGTQAVSAERMMLAHDLMARRIALMERMTEQVMEQSMGHK